MLPAVPPDRFDGQPLRYTLRDGKPVLYSVGADLDDDGGKRFEPQESGGQARAAQWRHPREVERLHRERPSEIPDADWVLWPAE